MRKLGGSWPVELASGVLLGCFAVGIRYLLDPYLGNRQPYTPIHAITALTVWFLGARAATVAAVVAQLLASYFFIPPRGHFFGHGWPGVFTYYLTAGIIVYFGYKAKTSIAALHRMDQEKDDFLTTLAHELRSPLSALQSAINLLRHNWRTGADSEEVLRMQERQVAHLTRLADDLSDVRRIKDGNLKVQTQVVDLRECIAAACEAASVAINARHQRCTVNVGDSPLPVVADRARIVQVLLNLVNNASRYSPNESEIGITAIRDRDHVRVEVVDEGVGIKPEALPQIFDAYYTTSAQGRGAAGLGVGLWLAKRIVELHGGTIGGRPRDTGRGSVFYVTLPLADSRPESDSKDG